MGRMLLLFAAAILLIAGGWVWAWPTPRTTGS